MIVFHIIKAFIKLKQPYAKSKKNAIIVWLSQLIVSIVGDYSTIKKVNCLLQPPSKGSKGTTFSSSDAREQTQNARRPFVSSPHQSEASVNGHSTKVPLQVEAAQGREGGDAFVTQQLTGGRFPVEAELQPAADARVLLVGPAGPVHGSLHVLPVWRSGGRRRRRRRRTRRRKKRRKRSRRRRFEEKKEEEVWEEDTWTHSFPAMWLIGYSGLQVMGHWCMEKLKGSQGHNCHTTVILFLICTFNNMNLDSGPGFSHSIHP